MSLASWIWQYFVIVIFNLSLFNLPPIFHLNFFNKEKTMLYLKDQLIRKLRSQSIATKAVSVTNS